MSRSRNYQKSRLKRTWKVSRPRRSSRGRERIYGSKKYKKGMSFGAAKGLDMVDAPPAIAWGNAEELVYSWVTVARVWTFKQLSVLSRTCDAGFKK